MRLKKLISAALALAVMCGIGATVPITTSADTIENEIVVYSLDSTDYDYTALTSSASTDAAGVLYPTVNGLAGYSTWVNAARSASYTYTDVNNTEHDYTFTHAWQGGGGNNSKQRNLYFTPKSAGKVTVIFDGNDNADRIMYIEQNGDKKQEKTVASGISTLSMTFSNTTQPIYIYGGGSNKNIYAIIVEYYEKAVAAKIPAFPGAEGGGKYTTGARGADDISVYHVTNLNDSGPGSLRDAVSKSGRIIVFDVGGVIELRSTLNIKSNNITILGQTAPGDGITLVNFDAKLPDHTENQIIRYLRIRPTDVKGLEMDGLGGRWVHNIILDHCSLSWSCDELLTVYAGSLESNTDASSNISVQYCLASESMRMSNHIKGAHGYGGIIGGTDATYHHNLFAHHDSRSPRFDRNLKNTDFVNNVIYDWGNTNSMYGAEPYSYSKKAEFSTPDYASNINIRNNYMKYGPATRPSLRSRIFDASIDTVSYNGSPLKSNFYINGNYVEGNAAVTADNASALGTDGASGIYYKSGTTAPNLLTEPVSMNDLDIEMQTAQGAYETVLNSVGASLPKRDEIDARIVADVKNGTGRIINTDEEVGSYLGIQNSESRVFTIPQEWKNAHNMGSASETDIAPSGYTWIEEYVNDWTAEQEATAPTNPDITVTSPAVATTEMTFDKHNNKGFWYVGDSSKRVRYEAVATAKTGTTITKMELWDGTEKIKTYDGESSIDDNIALTPGTHYLMCKAYNNLGERTQSPLSIVYITGTATDGIEIGATPYEGKSSVWKSGDKTYIAGSGLINNKSDVCAFDACHANGDFSFSCKIEDIPKYENSTQAGIMFRESLDADSRMIMVSDLWRKYGENIQIAKRLTANGNLALEYMKNSSNTTVANSSSYDSSQHALPKYLKIERSEGTLTVSVSDDGQDWTNNERQPMTYDVSGWSAGGYVGLAVDSVNGNAADVSQPPLAWFTIAAFSDIQTSGLDAKAEVAAAPTAEPAPTPNPDATERPEITPIPTGTPKPTATPTTTPTTTPTASPTATPTAEPDNTKCVKITAEYNADGSLKSVTIVNTTVKDAGTPVLTGLNRVYIWKTLNGMEPVEVSE